MRLIVGVHRMGATGSRIWNPGLTKQRGIGGKVEEASQRESKKG